MKYLDLLNTKYNRLYANSILKGKLKIGDNVWIGDKAIILAGETIGSISIVAANAIATNNVPQNAVV